MKPSDFQRYPWSSRAGKAEAETVALNIILILVSTGNEWRKLPEKEHKAERKKDSNYTPAELEYFRQVRDYTVSPEAARLFSPYWQEVYNKNKQQ
jgi:hypothetical protein